MFELDGFKPFNFSEGVPYVSITPNGLTFNKAVTMKLDYPEYVQLLINNDKKLMALLPCEEHTPNATSFYKEKSNGILSVRWNTRDLLNTLEYMMGWNLRNASYRVDGRLLEESRVMVFDLNGAAELG